MRTALICSCLVLATLCGVLVSRELGGDKLAGTGVAWLLGLLTWKLGR